MDEKFSYHSSLFDEKDSDYQMKLLNKLSYSNDILPNNTYETAENNFNYQNQSSEYHCNSFELEADNKNLKPNDELICYLNTKDYTQVLELIVKFCWEKDMIIKSELYKKLNELLKFQYSAKQYQNIMNLILTLIETKKDNYFSDPLKSFYNQELLNLIRTQQENQLHQTYQTSNSCINRIIPQVNSTQSLPSLLLTNKDAAPQSNTTTNTNDWSISNCNTNSLFHQQRMVYNQDLNFSNNSNCSLNQESIMKKTDYSLKDEIEMLSLSYSNKMSIYENDIERAATLYRNSATAVAQRREATFQWTGRLDIPNFDRMLLKRSNCNGSLVLFSRKVFLGGVPWDSTEEDLRNAFNRFGPLTVAFPHKELNGVARNKIGVNSMKGYCYLIFDLEESVNRLLANCCHNNSTGGDYFRICSAKFRSKEVQVIPWLLSDSQTFRVNNINNSTNPSNSATITTTPIPTSTSSQLSSNHQSFVDQINMLSINNMQFNELDASKSQHMSSFKPDSKRTVFIGALHGMLTALNLAKIMNDLFDNVVFAALDTDKYKYPIGSGRVTFSDQKSFMRAVTANFVHIKTQKFSKTIQIDPYLEDSVCNNCFQSAGIYFCRSFECFRYFCCACWQNWHSRGSHSLQLHKPLRRTFKPLFDSNTRQSPPSSIATASSASIATNNLLSQFNSNPNESCFIDNIDNIDSIAVSSTLNCLNF